MTELTSRAAADAVSKLVDSVASHAGAFIRRNVDERVRQAPDARLEEIAERLVAEYSTKCGIAGAFTSLGGALTLPVTVPGNLVATWSLQIQMVYAIGHLYGWSGDNHDFTFDFFAVAFADSFKETFKTLGVEATKHLTRKAVQEHITRETMKKINTVVPRTILTKAGEQSVTSFARLVPLAGAPVGYALDRHYCRQIGRAAINYYRTRPDGSHVAVAA